MPAVFLSHSSSDNEFALTLAKELRTNGFDSLFLDIDPERGIQGGKKWEAVLYSNLIASRAVIVLHSQHWKNSRWCFAEITHAKMLERTIIPVCLDSSPLDGSLAAFQAIPFSNPTAIARLIKGLQAAGIDPRSLRSWLPGRCPFPGLEPFRAEQSPAFFGREQEIRRIVDRLTLLRRLGNRHFVLLTGSSGSGKSSLMLAGLIPILAANSTSWTISTVFRPGREPLTALNAGLVDLKTHRTNQGDERSVHDRVRVIVIDQLEELFTNGTPEEAESFLRELRKVERESQSVLILATLRTDSLSSFEKVARAVEIDFDILQVVPLSRSELPSVITGPCELDGIAIEDGVVDEIVAECGDGRALPLLAYTLREMYELTTAPRQFTMSLYRDKLGGIRAALNRTIDTIMSSAAAAKLSNVDLRRTFFPFVRLTESGEFAKRRVYVDDLPGYSQDLIRQFIEARLLVIDTSAGRQTVEVAHDMVFRDWAVLSRWLVQYRSFFEWERSFGQAILEWERNRTTLSSAALRDLLHWKRAGLVTQNAKIDELVQSSTKEVRAINLAKGVVSSLRLGLSFAGGWLLAWLLSLAVRPVLSNDNLVQTNLEPLCYSCLLGFVLAVSAIGAVVGVVGVRRRLATATSVASLFLLVAVGNGISAMVPNSAGWIGGIVRSLPVGVAFFAACSMLSLLVRKRITLPSASVAAAIGMLLVVFNVTTNPESYDSVPPLEALLKGLLLFPELPIPTLSRVLGPFIMSFFAGAWIGWYNRPEYSNSAEQGELRFGFVRSRHLPLLSASLLFLCVLGTLGLGYYAEYLKEMTSQLAYSKGLSTQLIAAQNSVRKVTGSFAKSYSEIKAFEQRLVDQYSEQCAARGDSIFGPPPSQDLEILDTLVTFEGSMRSQVQVQVLYADAQTWNGRVSSARNPNRGCEVSPDGAQCDQVFDAYSGLVGWNGRLSGTIYSCNSLEEINASPGKAAR
jgi:hypothetical protein